LIFETMYRHAGQGVEIASVKNFYDLLRAVLADLSR
jgi:hypothetical protein